jgi:hypothetical protein
MPLKPAAFTSSNVVATTGGLFQEPSVSTASRVLPRFQPGLMFAKNADAEIGVKVPGHVAPPVGVAEAVDLMVEEEEEGLTVEEEEEGLAVDMDEDLAVVVTGLTDEEVLIDVTSVELGTAEALVEVFTEVSTRHWE